MMRRDDVQTPTRWPVIEPGPFVWAHTVDEVVRPCEVYAYDVLYPACVTYRATVDAEARRPSRPLAAETSSRRLL